MCCVIGLSCDAVKKQSFPLFFHLEMGGKAEDKPGFSPQTHTCVSSSGVSSRLSPILMTGVGVGGIVKCV